VVLYDVKRQFSFSKRKFEDRYIIADPGTD
jgi:hypothetical protein